MTIPTGHLYRFMAFFGLLLFITCVLFPYLKYDDNDNKISDIRRNLVVITHEREVLVNQIKAIEDLQVEAISNPDESSSIIRSSTAKISEIRKGIDLRTKQIGLENQILEQKLEKQHDIKYFMGYFIIFSSLITFLGFIFWYLKIQRPLNSSIKLEFIKHVSKD